MHQSKEKEEMLTIIATNTTTAIQITIIALQFWENLNTGNVFNKDFLPHVQQPQLYLTNFDKNAKMWKNTALTTCIQVLYFFQDIKSWFLMPLAFNSPDKDDPLRILQKFLMSKN